MYKYSTIFIGESNKISSLKSKFQENYNSQFYWLPGNYDYSILLEKIIKKKPNLIIIQLSKVSTELYSFLLVIKSHTNLESTRIVAIFDNEDNLFQFSDIYSFGVDFGFLESEEEDKILADLGSLLNPNENTPLAYARAKNLNIPVSVKFLAKLTAFHRDCLSIESSLKLSANDFFEAQSFFNENFTLKYFQVQKVDRSIARSFFSHTYDVKLIRKQSVIEENFSSSELNTSQSLVDKYFDTYTPVENYRNDRALIIDSRVETHFTFAKLLNEKNKFYKLVNTLEDIELVAKFRPEVISFQIEHNISDEFAKLANDTDAFNKLISAIARIKDYDPVVIVFGERSRSEAYQKAYNYKKIIVHQHDFKIQYLDILIKGLQEHRVVHQRNSIFLCPPDRRSVFKIVKDIRLTSLSENLVTFTSEFEIPDFNTFMIDLPFNFYITVFPLGLELDSQKGLYHYHGLISNVSEEAKSELRQIVNHLIKESPGEDIEFEFKSIKDINKDAIQMRSKEIKEEREKQAAALKKAAQEKTSDEF